MTTSKLIKTDHKMLLSVYFALFFAFSSAPLWAQTTNEPAYQSAITFSYSHDNDLFSVFPTDRYYTNGLRLAWLMDRHTATPDWALKMANVVPFFSTQQPLRHGYTIGQNMYTPDHTDNPITDSNDRPYAGWLYAAINIAAESGNQLDIVSFTVGIIGPWSGAEQAQKLTHELIGNSQPIGWDSQLENELGLNMAYQRSWRKLFIQPINQYEIDVTPHINGALGNVYTFIGSGITLRFGADLPNDYGAPRINHGLPSTSMLSPTKSASWYVFTGVEARAVAHNIFLDGNTFVDSRKVNKETLINDLQLGLVFDWPNMRIGYSHTYRSKEFKTQPKDHNFATLSFTFKL